MTDPNTGDGGVLVARRTDRLEELASGIRDLGRACVPLTADLRDAAQARSCVDETAERFGRLDVLVNSVGYVAVAGVEEGDPENWERIVDLNRKAVLHTSQQALPHLLRAAADGPRGVADLVTLSSVAGRDNPTTGTVAAGMPQEDWLHAEDIARCVGFMVTQPAHAAVNEILVRPTAQEH
ncbi:SDR family oxidoreductase [Streptomyces sp. NPDC001700]